jgi:crotonobetainyl-CoA:carnitine CoA-transferase CaiB-like acyl-CoA transferase
MIVEVEHPVAGTVRAIGVAAKMSETPGSVRMPSPLFGQHTDEILSQVLGLSAPEIAQLRADRVV